MPRYYFDLSYGGGWEPDEIGTEFPDDAAAELAAIRYLGEVPTHEPYRLASGSIRLDLHDRDDGFRYSTMVNSQRAVG